MEINNDKIIGICEELVEQRNGELYNVYLSGSHSYGWESDDSDLDIRGTYVSPSNDFLALNRLNNKPIDIDLEHNGIKYDIVLREIGHELSLALKGNYNTFEGFTLPQIYAHPTFEDLAPLVSNCHFKGSLRYDEKKDIDYIAGGIAGAYYNMAKGNYEKYIESGKQVTAKKYLYVIRGLLACQYYLLTGNIEPNFQKLLFLHFNYDSNIYQNELVQLLAIKQDGTEDMVLGKGRLSDLLDEYIQVEKEEAITCWKYSLMPTEPFKESVEQLNDFLVALRSIW